MYQHRMTFRVIYKFQASFVLVDSVRLSMYRHASKNTTPQTKSHAAQTELRIQAENHLNTSSMDATDYKQNAEERKQKKNWQSGALIDWWWYFMTKIACIAMRLG